MNMASPDISPTITDLTPEITSVIMEHTAFQPCVAILSYRTMPDSFDDHHDPAEYQGGWTTVMAHGSHSQVGNEYKDLSAHRGCKHKDTDAARLNTLTSLCQGVPDSELSFLSSPIYYHLSVLHENDHDGAYLIFEWYTAERKKMRIGVTTFSLNPQILHQFTNVHNARPLLHDILNHIFSHDWWMRIMNNPDARLTFRTLPAAALLGQTSRGMAARRSIHMKQPFLSLANLPTTSIPTFTSRPPPPTHL